MTAVESFSGDLPNIKNIVKSATFLLPPSFPPFPPPGHIIHVNASMYMSPRLHADDVVIKRINKLSKNMCAKRRKEVPKQKGGEMGGVAGGLEPGGVTFRCVYGAYILALLYVLGRATNRNVRGRKGPGTQNLFLEASLVFSYSYISSPWILFHAVDFVNVLWSYSCSAADNCQLNGRLRGAGPRAWHRTKPQRNLRTHCRKVLLGWQCATYLLFMTYAVQKGENRDPWRGATVCRRIVPVRREKFKLQDKVP